jgi:hypothetical protein
MFRSKAEAMAYRWSDYAGPYRPRQCAALIERPHSGKTLFWCSHAGKYGPDGMYCAAHARKYADWLKKSLTSSESSGNVTP